LTEIDGLFVEVLKIAREWLLLKLGTVATAARSTPMRAGTVRCLMSGED
jgi:hypothetical protein